MADTVLYQTDDDLSQANLAASAKRQNAEDYVERGLSLSNYDSGALTVDVSAGHCVLSAGSNAAYDVFPDARTGVSLTGSATNSVYVVIDPTAQDDVTVEALDSGTPANPYLKIGEVDTSADTVSDVARDPDGTFESVSAEEATIGSGSTVTGGPVGDSEEWVPLTVLRFGGASFDVTSTTYTDFSPRENRAHLDTGDIDLTNISDLAISLTATIATDTGGESTTWRLRELGGPEFDMTEVVATGTSAQGESSDRDIDLNDSASFWVVLQGKVGTSGPTGTIYNPIAIIWGQIA